jgi:FtsP/CotA-like multicopper oxidase with cupredoxin domain
MCPARTGCNSHLGLQKQALMTAPLIVRYAAPRDEQEVVVLLEDFSFTPADEILAKLLGGGMGAMPNAAGSMPDAMTAGPTGAMGAMGGMGPVDRLRTLKGPGRRSAAAVDVNDIEYDAYLANERTLDDPEVIGIEGRARIRLRLINGAAATAFHLDLGEVVGTLVGVDGEDLAEPVRLSSMPLAVAQRADILLDLQPGTGAVPILFRREGARERTGVVLRPPGAPVRRLAELGDPAPPIGLDLEARLKGPATPAPAARSVVVPLTGDMAAYRWGMGEVPPLRQGERIELELRNTTMMAHPMHLHGHRFQVVAINGRRMAGASRDTVLVPPMQTVTIGFDANNPGPWPFHCHHLYHQVRGMESVLRYG